MPIIEYLYYLLFSERINSLCVLLPNSGGMGRCRTHRSTAISIGLGLRVVTKLITVTAGCNGPPNENISLAAIAAAALNKRASQQPRGDITMEET